MTKPEHVKRWWGRLGEGYSVPVCEIDLRVGRQVALREPAPARARSPSTANTGRSRRPSRLVFTETMEPHPEPGSVVTAVFTEEGGKTRLTVTARYPSPEVRDIVLGTGMERGAGISYDRLEDLVAELQRS